MTAVAADGSGLSTSRPLELRKRCLIWLASRLTVAAILVTGALLRHVDAPLRQADPWTWLLYRFAAWDSHLYAAIAARGYVADGPASHYNAFFPGLPGVMRLWTSLTGTDGRWGGLIVVELAGLVAALLLGRLAEESSGRASAGTVAVLLLSVAPLTVFFAVVYTEAIFVCLGVGAWLAARRGRWWLAGLLAGLASVFRINGLFLVAALVVWYGQAERREGTWVPRFRPGALGLAVGPLFVTAWFVWLRNLTGRWDAWTFAQRDGWGRMLAWPWTGVERGLRNLALASDWHTALTRVFDLVALAVAVAVPFLYLRRRDWAAATFLGLSAASIVFSSTLASAARYVLVWFPLYETVANWLVERPVARRTALITSAVVALVVSYSWSQRYWVG